MELTFIGTGLMGRPMIENLLINGHAVRVWNRTAEKAKRLAAKGATVAASPKEACTGADVVLSCLSDDASVRAVFGDADVLDALADGAVHLSMTTISPGCAREMARLHAAHGVGYVAAPILGRPDLVAACKQGHLLSGPSAGKAKAREVLTPISLIVFDVGEEVGAANVAKLAFNFLIASAVEGMSEAFAFLEASGLDPGTFHQIMTATLFGCPLYEGYGQQILDRSYEEPGFKLSLGLKDIRLAAEAATAVNARLPLAEVLRARFERAIEHGRAGMDWSAVSAEARQEAGLSV